MEANAMRSTEVIGDVSLNARCSAETASARSNAARGLPAGSSAAEDAVRVGGSPDVGRAGLPGGGNRNPSSEFGRCPMLRPPLGPGRELTPRSPSEAATTRPAPTARGVGKVIPLVDRDPSDPTRQMVELAQRGRMILDVSSADLEAAEAAFGPFHSTAWHF